MAGNSSIIRVYLSSIAELKISSILDSTRTIYRRMHLWLEIDLYKDVLMGYYETGIGGVKI